MRSTWPFGINIIIIAERNKKLFKRNMLYFLVHILCRALNLGPLFRKKLLLRLDSSTIQSALLAGTNSKSMLFYVNPQMFLAGTIGQRRFLKPEEVPPGLTANRAIKPAP